MVLNVLPLPTEHIFIKGPNKGLMRILPFIFSVDIYHKESGERCIVFIIIA